MPAANPEQSIFLAALELPTPAERAAYLKGACGADPALLANVRELLATHENDDGFLDRPPPNATVDEQPVTERPGTVIGPYKLKEQIGEGGMGLVFVAEQQEPVRRKVALKIIKPGMDSKQVIARFEAERQALAMMDHQNIAKVFEAGTTESGRPYFVMELVHGVPITEYCDANKLTPRHRLELFVPVCQAIQHAHHKGVIHRDIKPSNVLVTMYDDRPVPKVIDFGVAKAVEQRLTEKSVYTQFGTLVGTFEYMSPEQAEMNAFGVDTRSDVYALGVLLYELLTGTTPLERQRLREAAFDEIRRIIKEEEPQRPSVRLSTSGALAKVAEARKTEPAKLTALMRGELDWVVMKCLEKDRSRRYDTASGLARDVERYLKDEPVEACPPSLAYRIRKVTRRHRGLLTTAAAFAAVLIAGAAVSGWLAVRATHSARQAQDARQDAEQALQDVDLARKDAVAAKEDLERASRRLRTATHTLNEGIEFYYRSERASALEKLSAAASVEPELNTIYLYRRALYTNLGLWDLAAADYAQSLRLAPPSSAATCFEHALLQAFVGNKSGYREACKEFVRQYGDTTNNDDAAYLLQACVLSPSDPVIERSELLRWAEVLAISTTYHRLVAASAFLRAEDYRRANDLCQGILDTFAKRGEDRPRLVHAFQAIALQKLGRPEEARQSLTGMEAAIDQSTTNMLVSPVGGTAISWSSWLLLLHWRREAAAVLTGSPPPADPRLAVLRQRGMEVTKGDVYTHVAAGRKAVERKAWDEAAASFATALDKLHLSVRPGPANGPFFLEMVQEPEVFEKLVALRPRPPLWWSRGSVLAGRRQWPQAANHYARALRSLDEFARLTEEEKLRQLSQERGSELTRYEQKFWLERTKRPGPVPNVLYLLAVVRLLAGDEKGYQEACDRIARDADSVVGPLDAQLLSRALTVSAAKTIDTSAAVRLAERAAAAEPKVSWHWHALGAAQYRAGKHEEAIGTLEKSIRLDPAWLGRGQNYAFLAMACQKLGRHEEARAWLARARPAFVELEQTIGKMKYGFAGSNYRGDWFTLQILLPEAEKLLKR